MSNNQGKRRRDAIEPAAGREIPRGTDEESDSENSQADGSRSAKPSTPSEQRPPQQTPTDRDDD